jgi:hypothetical protein
MKEKKFLLKKSKTQIKLKKLKKTIKTKTFKNKKLSWKSLQMKD